MGLIHSSLRTEANGKIFRFRERGLHDGKVGKCYPGGPFSWLPTSRIEAYYENQKRYWSSRGKKVPTI